MIDFSGTFSSLSALIDCTPVSTATDSPGDALGRGSAGSRQMDLDMENIESISVLRGAAATALYGSRAANGAIIIKTKSGKQGEPLRFNFNTEFRADRPIIEGYITDWAAGSRGYFCNGRIASQGGWCEPGYPGTNSETRNNWGPHKDSIPQVVFDSLGPIRFRDARSDFYKTGRSVDNTLRGSGSLGQRAVYTFGGTYLHQQGFNPAAKLKRLNLNMNLNLNLSSRLTSATSIQRARSDNPFSDDSFNGVDHALIDTPPSTNVRQSYMPDGSPILFGTNQGSFGWVLENERNTELTNRWIASQQFGYQLPFGLKLSNNVGLDAYVTEYGRFLNERPWRTAQNLTSGSTTQRKTTRTTINDDLLLSLESRPVGATGINISGLLGSNLYMQDASFVEGSGTDIVIPNYFNVSNFITRTNQANLTTKRRIVGAYGSLTADYGDWAFLTLTGRNDWSSTLPTDHNAYFYPSASLGVVFTDALKWQSRILNYGKVRISKAKVGNDAPPYSLSTRYVTGTLGKGANNDQQQFGGPAIQFPFRGVTAYTQSTQLGNPILRPESTVEDEIGLELRFFDSRARMEVSAYRKSSYDQIFSVPSSAVTGFTSITRNAGDLRNKGLEVTLGGRALEIGKFSWDANVNWATNKSKVLSLAPGVTSLTLAGYSWPQIRIMEGQPYGVIWGYGWKRNCVEPNPCHSTAPKGEMLIGNDGYPIKTDELRNLGAVPAKWTGSATSDFRYRNFTLSGLLDVRRGSRIINFETQYETGNGRSILTKDRYTYVTHKGININTGQQNAVRLFKDQDYYGLVYGFDRHEAQIEPGGYVKLRLATLNYQVPQKLSSRAGLDNASVYMTGRNLAVWSNFSVGDPEGDVYGGQNAGGQYFRQFNDTQSRTWIFGVRTTF
jgi:TonB-linked SusC/RagA family outer membrane protein